MTTKFLKRTLMKILRYILKFYWKIFQPITIGVRIIIINEKNQYLLVKHRDDQCWYLPGGGVKSKETLYNALKRELIEEVGDIKYNNEDLNIFGIYTSFNEGKNDTIVVFALKNLVMNYKSNIEVEDIGYFDINNLPIKVSQGTSKRLKEHNQGYKVKSELW